MDIGFVPLMQLKSIIPGDSQSFVWDEEISVEDAFAELEKRMYPFKEVSQ